MIPADLLGRLQEKDPELYENIAKSFAWAELQYDELYPEYVGDKPHLPDEIEIDNHMEHLIQGCLQEAIRARGWMCTVLSVPTNGHVLARIDTEGEESGTVEYGDTEAEALCRAYLAAIQAEDKT